jgi:hypothetical protein
MLNFRSLKVDDCDTDHYQVVAKVREKLAVRKEATQKSDIEKLNFRNQNGLEVSKQYQIKISYRFAGLDNLSNSED